MHKDMNAAKGGGRENGKVMGGEEEDTAHQVAEQGPGDSR